MPLIFSGVSRRLVGLPMSLKSFGSLSATFCGGVRCAARSTSSPYESCAPRGGVNDLAVLGSAARRIDLPRLGRGGDQHRRAPSRRPCAVAPTRSRCWCCRQSSGCHTRVVVGRVHRRGLDAHLAPVGFQLLGHQHRQRRYTTPCPISEWLAMTVTDSSVPMRTKALGAKVVVDGCAAPAGSPAGCRVKRRVPSLRQPPCSVLRNPPAEIDRSRSSLHLLRPSAGPPDGWRGGCADRSRSGRYCPSSRRRCRRRWACGFSRSSTAAAMICPDWQ